jgi:hypothetical protein
VATDWRDLAKTRRSRQLWISRGRSCDKRPARPARPTTMRGTALIYSSHNRSNWIHDHFIVQRALQGNRRILFLPNSETVQNGSEMERQEFSWGTFRWFFSFYERHGLQAMPFFWSSQLRKHDVDVLWNHLYNAEVVILGGGHSATGLRRYKQLGAHFDGEWGKFGRILHERQMRGMLTVGFSAGADQLCETLFREVHGHGGDNDAFGLVRNVMCTLHHDSSRNGDLHYAAGRYPHMRVFGLPNDAGLNVDQGQLPSGNFWQIIEFVVDQSWDDPEDFFHIKTRQGALIDHFYADGRHWAFRGGDMLIRVTSPDGRYDESWMILQGRMVHYWTQSPSRYQSINHILTSH